jgi:hypothetical protein
MQNGNPTHASPRDELRAFVATRLGGHSWVVDLLPNYDLSIGSAADVDVRIGGPEVQPRHATLTWNGEHLWLRDLGAHGHMDVNGEAVRGEQRLDPGDEIRVGPAILVVNVTLAPTRRGRRSLTHQEFAERVSEELARAGRSGRATCLVMLKSRSGDGARLADAALSSFRDGDIVGTYAHDEIEFLLPDTPPNIARAVVGRLLETSGTSQCAAGLAVSPEDGDDAERLTRAAREALAKALGQGGGIARSAAVEIDAVASSVHTEATRVVMDEVARAAAGDEPLLLVGEPNSGKRFYARVFHDKSNRASGPFVTIACAGLVDAESVLRAFGPEQGDVSACLAETARGGTLALEDVGDLPMPGQRRLLSLFERGSEDYNVIATTHRELSALCQVGAFARDLHNKLSAQRIQVPALRMRMESIVPLAQSFARHFKSVKPVRLSPGAIDRMRAYSWPGNVLELRNAMERAVALADGGEILAPVVRRVLPPGRDALARIEDLRP